MHIRSVHKLENPAKPSAHCEAGPTPAPTTTTRVIVGVFIIDAMMILPDDEARAAKSFHA
jgi:hypothetical protein